MHDNALAKALAADGWDVQLVPTYTPIRTDERDSSVDQVFFGGINVFLQQKIPLFRYLPAVLDRFLDNPKLIRRVTSQTHEMSPKFLGQLALSMLKGTGGNQRKEVLRLCRWLKSQQPDLILFTNILIGGCIPEIKKQSPAPILVTLQGDDVFLDSLEPQHKSACIERIKELSNQVDGFIVHSEFFRDYMSQYFGFNKEKIFVTPLGLDVNDFRKLESTTSEIKKIGYLAKLAPQKGLHNLVDAFIELKKLPDTENVKLEIAGWLGPENQAFAEQQIKRLRYAGLKKEFEYLGAIEREEKLSMLKGLHVLSVPTEFLEPKGLYLLEAMAAGVPVVQPAHACFLELVEQSQGGILYEVGNVQEHVTALMSVLSDDNLRQKLSQSGRDFVHQNRNAHAMAVSTGGILERFIGN